MAQEAYPYIIFLALLTIMIAFMQLYLIAAIFFILLLFVIYFFRDPERSIPDEKDIVVAPADGRVTKVVAINPEIANSPNLISIFLSPLDVHINRSPIAGKISDINYVKGRFVPATREDASLINEQNVITIENGSVKVIMKQIAGIVARRCVLWKKTGESVDLGERLGLIKFSSRTDLILPAEFRILIKAGDKLKGGVTIIGRKNSNG
ncbi:MAG: phosphatidylserine decarboxylase [Blastocatellia bacterium]|nr:phosphatidylserine decarboxylase [Blastocatellia bacterium]MBN8721713.1 phosphatidylserine decarboxylase [Acidobacteriota bacterium]